MKYIDITEILKTDDSSYHYESNKHSHVIPARLDKIDFIYKGIQFHIYGVLHGILGGTNKEYRQLVIDTVRSSRGLRISEKMFKCRYKGIDYETDDWAQIPFTDAFMIGFTFIMTPYRIYNLLKTIFIENFTPYDKFSYTNYRQLNNIGGSRYFHLLDPNKRRLLCGFPEPDRYFEINYCRRHGIHHNYQSPVFPDKDWQWLTYIEPFVNIPYRSVHMLEQSVLIAQSKNFQEVSLFVGEIHNSDMLWYQQTRATLEKQKNCTTKTNEQPDIEQRQVQLLVNELNTIEKKAKKLFSNKRYYKFYKFVYFFGLTLGTISIFSFYLFLIIITSLLFF